MSELEKDVDRAVTEALQLFGFDVSNFAQGYRPGGRRHGTTRQTKGIPDIYARHPILKLSFWVEVKAPGKKVKEGGDQEKWHRMEHACGGLVLVMTSGAEMAEYLSSNIREWRRQRDALEREVTPEELRQLSERTAQEGDLDSECGVQGVHEEGRVG